MRCAFGTPKEPAYSRSIPATLLANRHQRRGASADVPSLAVELTERFASARLARILIVGRTGRAGVEACTKAGPTPSQWPRIIMNNTIPCAADVIAHCVYVIGKYTHGRKAVGQIRPTELSLSARTLRFVSPTERPRWSATGCRPSPEAETDVSTQRGLGARLISFIAVLVQSRPQIDFYHPEQGLELTCTAATTSRAGAQDRLRRRPKTIMADRGCCGLHSRIAGSTRSTMDVLLSLGPHPIKVSGRRTFA